MQISQTARITTPLILLGCLSCGSEVTSQMTNFTPTQAAEAALATYDKNNDGNIDTVELEASPALVVGMRRLDLNSDGNLSQDEIAARFEAYKTQSDIVATQVQVVSRRRQPEAGARVVLAPEPFMGEGLQNYVCETGADGTGYPNGETVSMPGLPAGFYKVTITPSGGAAIVRGCELADDNPEANRITFQLD